MIIIRAPIANLGLWDYRGKIWDYGITTCLKLGLQKSALKLGLCISNSTKFWISIHSKLGLWDFTLFEIGITGLRLFWNWDYGITGPPYGGPLYSTYVWYDEIFLEQNSITFSGSEIQWSAKQLVLDHHYVTTTAAWSEFNIRDTPCVIYCVKSNRMQRAQKDENEQIYNWTFGPSEGCGGHLWYFWVTVLSFMIFTCLWVSTQ